MEQHEGEDSTERVGRRGSSETVSKKPLVRQWVIILSTTIPPPDLPRRRYADSSAPRFQQSCCECSASRQTLRRRFGMGDGLRFSRFVKNGRDAIVGGVKDAMGLRWSRSVCVVLEWICLLCGRQSHQNVVFSSIISTFSSSSYSCWDSLIMAWISRGHP